MSWMTLTKARRELRVVVLPISISSPVHDSLVCHMGRCAELLPAYRSDGPAGHLAAESAMAALEHASSALADNDLAEIIRAHSRLAGLYRESG